MKKSSKEEKILIVLYFGILIFLIIGATYGYFASTSKASSKTDIDITSNTTDSLIFDILNDLTITANMKNFSQNMDSISKTTTASATLRANDKTNRAEFNYYIYLEIDVNDLEYTTLEEKPELILTIIDPNNNEVTSGIENLEYKTVKDGKNRNISGFDITNKKGTYKLIDNYKIVATNQDTNNTKSQRWTVTATFVNLNSIQTDNTDKDFSGKIIMRKEPLELSNNEISAQIECRDTSLNLNETTTCSLYTNTLENIYGFSGEISSSSGILLSNITSDGNWQGSNNGTNKFDLYSSGLKGKILIGTFDIKLIQNQNEEIYLNNVIVTDKDFNDFSINNIKLEINYSGD